ncbi:unnamed protein product [Ambrosiozyma monospora]|uniref:Unnamed protein product n=1 Tax=Ambrosiozyma monospora TaxID=43982 RepID=A0ACB5SZW4_AMBMO|nr:unnamed protein product [Ambrosiozyma monospora]
MFSIDMVQFPLIPRKSKNLKMQTKWILILKKSVKDVFSQYSSVSTEIPEDKKLEKEVVHNLDSIEEDEDDDDVVEIVSDEDNDSPMKIKDTVPKILDSFQIHELKDRRYRSQLASQQLKPDIELEPDSDQDYRHKKNTNDDDYVIVLDQDERLADGRLAIGENEVNLQQKLQKMEIEEALFNYSNSSSDNDIDIIHVNTLNKDKVHKPQKPSSVVFTLPRVQKPMPVYSHEMESVRKEAVLLQKILQLNQQRHIDLRRRLEILKNDAKIGGAGS